MFGIPPELIKTFSDPAKLAALGNQIKAFYAAGKRVIEAKDTHEKLTEDGCDDSAVLMAADEELYNAVDAFKVEFEKLPPLDNVK